jgi:hypothetical protein
MIDERVAEWDLYLNTHFGEQRMAEKYFYIFVHWLRRAKCSWLFRIGLAVTPLELYVYKKESPLQTTIRNRVEW